MRLAVELVSRAGPEAGGAAGERWLRYRGLERRARASAVRAGHADEASLGALVACTYDLLTHGDEAAIDALEDSFDACPPGLWRAYLGQPLASHHSDREDYAAAGAVLERAFRGLEGSPEELRQAEQLLDPLRALVLTKRGRTNEALPIATRVWEGFEPLVGTEQELASAGQLVAALQILGDVLLSVDRPAEVVRVLTDFLERTRISDEVPGGRGSLEMRLAQAHLELQTREPGHAEPARGLLRRALAREDLRPDHRVLLRLREAQLELVEGRPAQALERLSELGDLSRLAAPPREIAFASALGLRALRRTARPADPDWRETLLSTLEDLVADWAARPLEEGGEGFLRTVEVRVAVAEALELVARERGPGAAIEWLARLEAANSLSRRLGAGAPALAEMAELLVPEGGGLLVLFYDDRSVGHAFTLDGAGAARHRVRLAGDRLQDARRYRALLHRPPETAGPERGRELEELAARLAADFFPPELARRLSGWERLVVVGQGALGLDVGSLPVIGAQPLALAKPMALQPSLPVAVHLARRPRAERSGLLLVHSPRVPVELGLPPLRLSAGEADELTSALGGVPLRDLEGEDATWHRVVEASRDVAALHLFTHGLVDPSRAVPAAFALAGSGASAVVGASEILAGEVPPLVVLSVCGAARGPERIGDPGAADLRGAFFRSGARALVATAADVDQVAVHRLMVHLHRALGRGASVAEALHRARLELRAEPGFEDPYFWTLVHAYGDAFREGIRPGPEPRATGASARLLLAGLAVLGVLAVGLRVRSRAGSAA